jgi:two-component system chemotaxis response regulator CheY
MSLSILVVDDDSQVRKLCRTTLEAAGYLVREATNGNTALEALEDFRFDVIVLDLCMPDMDGLEFLKAVNAGGTKLNIIVISGFMGGAMLKAGRYMGGSATLVKPFPPEALLSAVDELLVGTDPVRAHD